MRYIQPDVPCFGSSMVKVLVLRPCWWNPLRVSVPSDASKLAESRRLVGAKSEHAHGVHGHAGFSRPRRLFHGFDGF